MNIDIKLKNLSGIYSIFNLLNGKKYIGSSKNIYNRWHEHLHNLKNNKAHNLHLQNAWNKYGEENFVFNVLEYCKEEERFEREQYYIDFMLPEYNFSLQVVANSEREISEKQKLQISETLKKKYASGELKPFKRTDNAVKNYVYNIKNWTLSGIFEDFASTSRALKLDKATITSSKIVGRIYKDDYIITTEKFNDIIQLKNYFYENYMKAKTTVENINYIISFSDKDNLIYHRSYQACAKIVQCSPETLRNHTDATLNNPYKILKSDLFYCVSNEYIPIKGTAVPIEESLELLQTNIGEL